MVKVLVADKLAEAGLAALKARAGVEFEAKVGLDEDALAGEVGKFDGMIIRSGVKVTAKVLSNPGRLKAIARAGVGVDNVDLPAATKAGILVMNTPDANTIATAELTMALMLAVARRIPAAHEHTVSGQWNRSAFTGTQLEGKTLGLVGLGRVGSAVATRAMAFDMRVLAYDPFFKGDSAVEGQVRMVASVEDLLKEVDYLSIHAPKNEQTAGMIGAEQLAMMKDGARVINAARGGIVDEQALAEALENGKIAGAGFDVYSKEPPEGNPLLKAKNVVLTPHLGASAKEAQTAVAIEAVDVLLNYLLNQEIRSAVNVVGMPASMSERDRSYADLATRMAKLLSPLCEKGATRVQVTTHGKVLEPICATLARYGLIDVLDPYVDTRLNVINIDGFARERGIELSHATVGGQDDGPAKVVLTVLADGCEHSVEGAVYEDGLPRILSIDGYRMDIVPEGPMVLIRNDDKPGVIGLVGKTFGDHGVNIADMTLSRHQKMALMVLKVDDPAPEDAVQALQKQRPPIQMVRSVVLPPLP
ncbi:MAG TPA: phosphoglycerate dehydrogenase [Phycisphaerae bacterium]|nr:phosphoglycerate dehydrogenase [Phycisphaerae bacterium]